MRHFLMTAAALTLLTSSSRARADDIQQLPKDQQFLVKGIDGAIAWAQFAEIAEKKAGAEDVRKLATAIKEENQQCVQRLMDLAKKHKVAVVQGLSKEHKAAAERLGNLESKAFDEEYLRGVVDQHQKVIAICEAYLREGTADDIKAATKEGLAKMREHHDRAQKLLKNVK